MYMWGTLAGRICGNSDTGATWTASVFEQPGVRALEVNYRENVAMTYHHTGADDDDEVDQIPVVLRQPAKEVIRQRLPKEDNIRLCPLAKIAPLIR